MTVTVAHEAAAGDAPGTHRHSSRLPRGLQKSSRASKNTVNPNDQRGPAPQDQRAPPPLNVAHLITVGQENKRSRAAPLKGASKQFGLQSRARLRSFCSPAKECGPSEERSHERPCLWHSRAQARQRADRARSPRRKSLQRLPKPPRGAPGQLQQCVRGGGKY